MPGLTMPEGIRFHGGFLAAWRAMRKPIIEKIEAMMKRDAADGAAEQNYM